MKLPPSCAAVSLAEILICMGMMTIILGCLLSSSMALQKTLQGCESYAGNYSDQRRIIDFLGRDLRRSISIAATDAGGGPLPMTAGAVEIEDRATLAVTLPGYYQSDVPSDPDFDTVLPIVPSGQRLEYGTPTGAAPPVQVVFRKIYFAQEGCVCFLRQEAANQQVVVRHAENLHVRITIDADGRTGDIKAWFLGPFSRAQPLISTYDALMLRNTPLTP